MTKADYQNYAKQLIGQEFDDSNLLMTAFTHRSYVNEHSKSVREHNERLEFLGDAVLELVTTEHLYANYQHPEGILTNWRAALVRTESIGQAAAKLGFADYLRLSKGEKRGSKRARNQILANTFEAFLGAVYLDKGYQTTARFIDKHILSTLDTILETGTWLDAKTKLQEHIQSVEGLTPTYKVLEEDGPDHEKVFAVGVYVDGQLRGKGKGYSKQLAQQRAAEVALRRVGIK